MLKTPTKIMFYLQSFITFLIQKIDNIFVMVFAGTVQLFQTDRTSMCTLLLSIAFVILEIGTGELRMYPFFLNIFLLKFRIGEIQTFEISVLLVCYLSICLQITFILAQIKIPLLELAELHKFLCIFLFCPYLTLQPSQRCVWVAVKGLSS